MASGDLLERAQAARLGRRLQAGEHPLDDVRVCAEVVRAHRVHAGNLLRDAVLPQLWHVGLHHRHGAVHASVAVAADATRDAVDEDGVAVLLLHVLDGHVLAALQLDQVLGAVDDLQAAIRREERDVSRVEEAFLVKRLRRLLRHLVVPLRDRGAAHAHLSPAVDPLSLVHRVRVEVRLALRVLEVRAALELDLTGREGLSHDAVTAVPQLLGAPARTARLREGVALHQRHAERRSDEGLDLGADGTAPAGAGAHAAAHRLGERLEEHLEQRRVAALADGRGPRGEGHLEEVLDEEGRLAELLLDALLEDVPDLRHGHEHRRADLLDGAGWVRVAGKLVDRAVRAHSRGTAGAQGLGVGEANGHAHDHRGDLEAQLQDVRRWQVGQVDVAAWRDLELLEAVDDAPDRGAEVGVREHDALGRAGAAGGVHDDAHRSWRRRHHRHHALLAHLDDLLEAEHLHRGRRRDGHVHLGVGHIVGAVHDGRQRGHVLDVLEHELHVGLVAEQHRHVALAHGVGHRADAEGGVARGDAERLGVRSDHRRHPLGTGLLEDQQRVRARQRLKVLVRRDGFHAQLPQAGAKGQGRLLHLRVGLPLGLSEESHRLGAGLARRVHAQVLPGPEALDAGVLLETVAHGVEGGADVAHRGRRAQAVLHDGLAEDLGAFAAGVAHLMGIGSAQQRQNLANGA
mmetsp:Transcript_562/g.2037  ORF Transcript_562/g.2037 Transcript_562/m.2037 type:complete len:686 (+) Transcript_562:339-2396(+)|eukprot:scaffold462_cov195-Pinguiococcus_pyrenoidosus.AAC.59